MYPIALTSISRLVHPTETISQPVLGISRVHYAVSLQVSALSLLLLSLLSTTAVDNADEEGQLMNSLKEDIANAHEHPRTVLTESFVIACFTTTGCTGAAKRADTVATDEAGTPQPFQPTRAPMFTLLTSECTRRLDGFWRADRFRGRFGGLPRAGAVTSSAGFETPSSNTWVDSSRFEPGS